MKDRLYVRVCARADEHGVITPEAFTLNGHTLPITRVVERRETRQTKYGGQGTRYLVRVGQSDKRKGKLYWPQTKDLRMGPAVRHLIAATDEADAPTPKRGIRP